MYDLTTIEIALKKESKNFDFFRFVFNRVKTLYFRGEDNEKSPNDQEFEEMFFEKTIDELSVLKKECSEQIPKYLQNIEFKTDTAPTQMSTIRIYLLNYFAVDAILSSYKYCFREENKNNTSKLLMYGDDTHHYLMDVMQSLAQLEDFVSRSYTDGVVVHVSHEVRQKAIREERAPQRRGGKSKAEKDAERLEPDRQVLKEKWDQGNWTSRGRGKYVSFTNYIIDEKLVHLMDFDAIRNFISKYDQNKL